MNEKSNDMDGSKTLSYLKKVRTISSRISGIHPSSLGLHPAVYFYGVTGRYQPPAFLATVRFLMELEERRNFIEFTTHREKFEEFLVKYRYFTNQVIGDYGGWSRPVDALLTLYRLILAGVRSSKADAEIIASLQAELKLKSIKEITEGDRKYGKNFSRGAKSVTFLREALQKSLRCAICNARIHKRSIAFDHKDRKEDGGSGNVENAQLTHPFCNSGYKEHFHSRGEELPTLAGKAGEP